VSECRVILIRGPGDHHKAEMRPGEQIRVMDRFLEHALEHHARFGIPSPLSQQNAQTQPASREQPPIVTGTRYLYGVLKRSFSFTNQPERPEYSPRLRARVRRS
jgi:hypothetical protein